MGVSNVNQLNKIDLTKLKLGSKKVVNNKPEYLKMTGSIFNAPGVTTSTTNSLTEANTKKSLNELKSTTATKSTTTSDKTDSKENGTNIKSASEGKAAAKEAEGKASEVKSQQQEMKTSEATVNKYSADAQKKQKSAKAEDKKFQQTLKQQQNELKSNNATLQKIVKENLETQTEITNAQNELDNLLGSSTLSISNNNETTGSSNNSARIQELQTIIGTKSSLVQNNGKTIYSLQRTSSRTLTKMNKTNRNYVKTHQHNMKTVEQTQAKAGKVAQTAEKYSQIAAMVSQVGKSVNIAGKALVALGSSMSWAFGAGAALVTVGKVMQKVGTVVELVGNYGQTAANITKGAAMAADGNLSGAVQAFGSAVATGAAAVNSTTGLKQTFEQIDESAKDATKQLAAKTIARKEVSGMQDDQLGGLSKKQMRKSISSQLMADDSLDNVKSKTQLNNYADTAKANGKLSTAVDTAKKNYQTNTMAKLKEAGLDGKYTVTENGKIVDNATHQETTLSDIKKTSKKTARGIKRAMNGGASNTVSAFQNIAKKVGEAATKSTQKFDFSKFPQNLTSSAAMMTGTNQNTNKTKYKKPAPPQWDLDNNATFQRIWAYNRSKTATYGIKRG